MKKNEATRGRFIVLDGPDGAGKSTQVKLLAAELEKRGVTVKSLREPGGTALGEAIRALLLNQTTIHIDALAEAFLFQAARAHLIREVVGPALERGEWIICDRFTLSTLVYQGYAGGIKKKIIKQLSSAAIDGVKPDAYIVLTLPAKTSVDRRANRSADRMESKGETYLKNVFNGFATESKKRGSPYKKVDGQGTVEEVQKRIWSHIERVLTAVQSSKFKVNGTIGFTLRACKIIN